MAQINAELAIELAQKDIEKADRLFPNDQREFDATLALEWLLRLYPVFLPLILLSKWKDYSVLLSRLGRRNVRQEDPNQTRLDLYSAAGQITSLYQRFDQRERF